MGSRTCCRCLQRPHTSQSFAANYFNFRVSSLRSFSGSVLRAAKSIKDPSHPTGIWYHSLNPSSGQRWAVSLLPEAPSRPEAASILGVLSQTPGKGFESAQPYELAASSADNFATNAGFVQLLHKVLKEEIVPSDPTLEFEAKNRESGWAHITDSRHALMPGRIATPENILASIAFTDSAVHPDSYQANETYRVLTKAEGWIQLKQEWLQKVRRALLEKN
ncbi:hypothetical protein K437DRAFT_123621 [Tilletiaria anomala UBC 951]|uniref:Uncharacterized protein n=1 Tax=Tilletiaria anomala (strain ATCC 24038 / CBS 436.72 / UBC 951) TaxID=1037660 RepID=A0A066W2L9_TILAU|nr:uncharacterized protein K437DRAFT_123621 [Tilletiaria anomala UBC 951]KDN45314.1 hypothetical protein K437DRAFT_123621 [Tilletiaria anomala UBC 951]